MILASLLLLFACQGQKSPLAEGVVYYCENSQAQRVWAVAYGGPGKLGIYTQIPDARIVATDMAAAARRESYNFYSTANGQVLHVVITKVGEQKYIQLTGEGMR